MQITSIIAIYALFWVLSAFVILPIGVKSNSEMGMENTRGHADGAPANFQPKKILIRTTILSAVLFGLFYLNYQYGWIDRNDLNIFGRYDQQS